MTRKLSLNDIHYLRSILAQLRELRSSIEHGPTLGGEVLADNIDWLDCFISMHEPKAKP